MKQRNNSPMINRRKLQICIVVFISDPISLTLWGTPPLMICQGWLTSHWTWQIWGYRLRHGTPTLDASTVDSTATFSMVAPSHQWSESLSGHFTPHQHLSCCLLCGSIPSWNCCYSDQEPHHPRAEMMSSFLTFSSGSCSRVRHPKPASAAHNSRQSWRKDSWSLPCISTRLARHRDSDLGGLVLSNSSISPQTSLSPPPLPESNTHTWVLGRIYWIKSIQRLNFSTAYKDPPNLYYSAQLPRIDNTEAIVQDSNRRGEKMS